MSFQERVLDTYADRAMQEFDSNPVAKDFLRRMSDEFPAQFLGMAIKRLQSDKVSAAHRFLASVAVRRDEIALCLTSPSMVSREAAQRVFRRFVAADPSFDVTLARRLPNRYFSNDREALSGAHATRALDILDHSSHGRRLLPILGHLPDSPDPRLAAKGALFVGRRVQNPGWAAQMLSRPEPRMRANAVESLWGINTPEAIRVLEQFLEDRSNRVRGNVLAGFSMLGRKGVDTEVFSMASAESAPHRATAAWLMGRWAEPKWIEVLTPMLRDEAPEVRSRALLSLKEIRRREAAAAASETAAVARPEAAPVVPEAAEIVPIPDSKIALPWMPELRLDGRRFRSFG